MKVGDYARTCYGTIFKIENITEIDADGEYFKSKVKKNSVIKDLPNFMYAEGEILNKTSPNIIDLIEVGDFIGKVMVEEVKEFDDGTRIIVMADGFDEYDENEYFLEAGIVTHEQFSKMEHRLEEK